MNKKLLMVIGAGVILFVGGWLLGWSVTRTGHVDKEPQTTARAVRFWTCSMHPQIQQPQAGQCPICAMDLIAVYDDAASETLGPREIRLSPHAQKLAAITTTAVQRRSVTTDIRLVGKVEYDETKLAEITARVPGRLDRLYVDYTGVPVSKGDHLVDLYSPELLAAQEELIQSLAALAKLETSSGSVIHDRAVATIEASQEKLRLWGLTDEQIAEIQKSGKPQDHLTIYSPVSGIVIHKNALEGQYVQTGSPIYAIADLSQVWVKLDAYESDLQWLHYGQEVSFETEAYPGETFKRRIAFIDPVLDPRTRTVKVRVNVSNRDGRLKPEMFVRAVVSSQVAAEGKIIDPELADKYICPMHPEVVKESLASCDLCGMDLVSATSLGYVSATTALAEAPLVIPATAPLITGKRAVVYVAATDQEGVFEGREIVLGPRAGDHYIVRDGLREGEQVVVQGAFKIDSAIQIKAKPSMMSSDTVSQSESEHHPGETLPKLEEIYGLYLETQQGLVDGEFAAAMKVARQLPHSGHPALDEPIHHLGQAENLEQARARFAPLSLALRDAVKASRSVLTGKVYVVHCPMALDGKGASWLQANDDILNPYYGEAMLKCGAVEEIIE